MSCYSSTKKLVSRLQYAPHTCKKQFISSAAAAVATEVGTRRYERDAAASLPGPISREGVTSLLREVLTSLLREVLRAREEAKACPAISLNRIAPFVSIRLRCLQAKPIVYRLLLLLDGSTR